MTSVPLSVAEAEAALADEELVVLAEAALSEAKDVREACLEAGVPVVLGRDECCGGGCTPKLLVLAREADLERAVGVLRARWRALVDQGGSLSQPDPDLALTAHATDGDADLPCPACGTAAPLQEGACRDCGLMLA